MSMHKWMLSNVVAMLAIPGAVAAWTPSERAEFAADAAAAIVARAPVPLGTGFACQGGEAPTVLYATDFELGSGGWVVGGAGDWERGPVVPGVHSLCENPPPSEPTSAFSGSNVFATNLDGCYANQDPSAVSTLAQTFDFSSVRAPIVLEWRHWYHVFETFDRGEVFVNGVEVFRTPNSTATPDYVAEVADLSGFALNPSVAIEFSLFASSVVNRMGWYLDDIRILTCGPGIFSDGFESP